MDPRIIRLYDQFTHGGISRREFLDRLAALAGSTEPHHVVVIGDSVGKLDDRAVTYAEAVAGSSSAQAPRG